MRAAERIIVIEDGADLLREVVTREPLPSTELVFAGTGPMRGEYERAQAANDVRVEYIAPGRAA